jgi:hypothetical protein
MLPDPAYYVQPFSAGKWNLKKVKIMQFFGFSSQLFDTLRFKDADILGSMRPHKTSTKSICP